MKPVDPAYRNLLREMAHAHFRLKDQSTLFGWLWSFLNPLIAVTVLYVFFRSRLGGEVEQYPIFLLIGVIHYTHFSNSTNQAMHVLHTMRELTSDTVFPKELMVIGSVIASSIEFVLEMLVVVALVVVSGAGLSWALLLLPVVVALQVALVLCVSLILAGLYVFVRDIEHIYQVFLRLLFFATPIFYDLGFLGGGPARQIALLNPLTRLIEFSRSLLIRGEPGPLGLLPAFALVAAVCLGVAFVVFRRLEPGFAEYV